MDKIDEILKIKELLNSGVITKKEFTELKNKLLENSNKKSKVEISIDEKECPNCNIIISKEVQKCEFCDYDFISNQIESSNLNVSNTKNSRNKIFAFIIIVLALLSITWFFIDNAPNKTLSNDNVQKDEKVKYNVQSLINLKSEIDNSVAKNKLLNKSLSNYNEDNLKLLKFDGTELDFEVLHDNKSNINLIAETPRLSMNDGKYSEKHKYYLNKNNDVFAQESNFYYANFNEDLGVVITKKTTLTNYYFENKLVKSDTVFEDKSKSHISFKRYNNLSEYVKKTGLKLSFTAN